MQRNAIEPILGALVLSAAVAFLVYAYHKAGQRDFHGYPLTARFSSISGLQTGSDVKIGGVKVGEVTNIAIDPESYLAVVDLTIVPEIKVPEDSVASVATEGLLGGKFLGLEPGASDTMLKPGARIDRTEPSVSLESIIGQLMYGGGAGSGKPDPKAGAAPPASGNPGAAPAPASAPAHP
jgi:phospholipid/cholesterol/gamma-HCH transport system substrate-binding protein